MQVKKENQQKQITKTWISGQTSCTLVIPKTIATQHGLDVPSHIVIESKPEGILIKKLEI